ncbi:MAG: glutamyl-tRNA reductase [Planctomycetes bacterium]|nr:glutamyl-tRNA reductase [Planctomycetota bacterium]
MNRSSPDRPEILVVGLNHRTAEVSLRERLAVRADRAAAVLESVRAIGGVREAVVLSTCNRVEVWMAASPVPADPEGDVADLLAGHAGVGADEIRPALVRHAGQDALRHLLRVVTGLDALAVGETQVLSQAREAYLWAVGCDATGPVLNRAFQGAFRVAKRAHTQTPVDRGQNSVSAAAVDLVSKVFERLEDKTALVLGAGETGERTARQLASRGLGRIVVINRDAERASRLAQAVGGSADGWEALDERLVEADIVVSATDAPLPVLRAARVARAMERRRARPLFLVDIAVPRDIEEASGRIGHVYLYNIDDLQAVVDEATARRTQAVDACLALLDLEMPRLAASVWSAWDAAPALLSLQGDAERIRREEVERFLAEGNGTPLREEVERLTSRLVRRLLHEPLRALRREAQERQEAPAARDDGRPRAV